MSRPWDADVEVTADLACRLIDSQFPELAPARAEPLALGWDNAAFLVDGAWVFRLPRRRLGAECMRAELTWLPAVARGLPVPVSLSTSVGHPTAEYPYPFGGYRRIEGRTGCAVAVGPEAAEDVGRFLAALHAIPVPADAPGDAFRRADMPRRLERLAEPMARLERGGLDVRPVRDRMEVLSRAPPWQGPPSWLHGDLYARHLVLGAGGRLAGVIDWGDIHAGDTALDVSIAFSLFRGESRARFFHAYGEVGAATLDRARFRALHYGVLLLDYGVETGDEALVRVGGLALESALGVADDGRSHSRLAP